MQLLYIVHSLELEFDISTVEAAAGCDEFLSQMESATKSWKVGNCVEIMGFLDKVVFRGCVDPAR